MSLTRFETADGIELVIDGNGECFYPGYASLARVCSIGLAKPIYPTMVQRTVESLLGTLTEFEVKEAEVLTTQGLRTLTLLPRQIGTKVIKKYNENLYERMAEVGHLVFLHQLAGYKIESRMPEKPLTATQMFSLQAKINEEYESRLSEIESKIEVFEKRAIDAEKQLTALPPATNPCPKRTTRNNLNTLVRSYCHTNNLPHQNAWNNLYREFRDRYHTDLKRRSHNANSAPLDIAEASGVIDDLYDLAVELFR